jgi:Tol biopolymer transport system component
MVVLGAALAVFDVLLLTGTGVRWPQGAGLGCGQRVQAAGTLAAAQGGAPTGLLWLRLGARQPVPLVTADPAGLNHPAVSPDGRRIAFLAGSNGILARLQVCDLRTHTLRTVRMPVTASNFPLAWSRSGKTLAFLGGDALGYGADQRPFLVEPSGGHLRQLAGNSPWYYDGIAVSPDGTKLALLLQRKQPEGREPEQLSVLDLRTGSLRRVAGSSQVAEIDAVSWSPDSTRLVFSAYRQNANGGLYVVDTATKRLTPLLVRGPGARSPSWSPDGRSVAFVRGDARSSSIWQLDLATHRVRRLTRGGVDLAPAWAPGGKALVFVRRRLVG